MAMEKRGVIDDNTPPEQPKSCGCGHTCKSAADTPAPTHVQTRLEDTAAKESERKATEQRG